MNYLLQVNVIKIVEDLLSQFASAIPPLFNAILVFVIGWIIARVVSRIISKVLEKVGVDKLAERINQIDVVAQSNIKIVPSKLFSRVAYYILMLIFAVASTEILGMPAVSQLMSDILNYVPNLISALIVFVIGVLVADFLKGMVVTACKSLNIPATSLIGNAVFYFILLNVFMITLSQAKIDTEFIQDNLSIILAGGVLAFAIGYGFASKDFAANLLASFYNRNKVQEGDLITIAGSKGKVIGMDNNHIILQTEDSEVIVPLHKMTTEKVIIHKQ